MTNNLKMVTCEDVRREIENNNVKNLVLWLNPNNSVDVRCSNGSTFLTTAVKKANVEVVSFLLGKGANINQREAGGAIPLLIAIHLNRLDMIQCLVKREADIKLGDSYDTPLTAAVRKGCTEIVAFLIEKGANVTICDLKGMLPVLIAIKENKLAIVDLFLTKNIGKSVTDFDKNTILVFAIRNSSSLEIIQCLLKHDLDVNESKNEKTPLAWAAADGNVQVLKLLFSYGADMNLLNSDGNTALATAVQFKQLEAATYLIETGANFCQVGPKGKAPFLWAIHNEDLDMINLLLDNGAAYIIDTVVLDAIASGNLKIVQLLTKKGPFIQMANKINATTPLKKSLETGSTEIVKYLLDTGASVVNDLGNKAISTILQLLIEKKVEMAKLLTENGARICEFSDCGETLLTKMISLENFGMVKYFLAHGAKVDQANKRGLTPLVLADSMNSFQIFQYLVDCGASLTEEDQAKNPRLATRYQMAKEIDLKGSSRKEFNCDQEADEMNITCT